MARLTIYACLAAAAAGAALAWSFQAARLGADHGLQRAVVREADEVFMEHLLQVHGRAPASACAAGTASTSGALATTLTMEKLSCIDLPGATG